MKKYFYRKLLILLLVFLSVWGYAEHPGAEFYLLPENLEKLIRKGLSGNMEAGTSVWEHYALAVFDYEKDGIWYEFLAEGGHVSFQWNLGYMLSGYEEDTRKKIRALYWLFLAAKNGEDFSKEFIESKKFKLESSYPAPEESIYKKENDKISDYEIKVLIDYALRGGKKEAYRLYKYYKDYKKDETEAAYWLRIGSQNKDLNCQYEYGKYLLGKDDEYSKIRGGFWIKKAAQNGNAKAKELVKKLKESKNTLALLAYDEDFDLPNEELIELTKKGLAGNIEAGLRVYNYYTYVSFDRAKIEQWNEFLAETDRGKNQVKLSYCLNNEDTANENEKIRSLYWLFLVAENKEKYIQNIINAKNLKLESSYPTLSEDIYKKENDEISDYEIKVLIDYALRGGKKEACRLYEYYQDYKKDETEAAYWLRIGAQNKDSDCQYEYGKYSGQPHHKS